MENQVEQNEFRKALQTVHVFARLGAAFVWIYHGLVPKLLFRHADEIRLMQAGGIDLETTHELLPFVGAAEIAIGVFLLFTWRLGWPLLLSAAAMILALLGVSATSPAYLVAAFNPVSLNVATFVLSVIGVYALRKSSQSSM